MWEETETFFSLPIWRFIRNIRIHRLKYMYLNELNMMGV